VKKFQNAAREQERPYGKAHARAHPAAGCSRAGNAARWPFLLSPTGLRVFLDWPALLGRDKTAARIAAALTPWPTKNPAATRHFVIFSHVLSASIARKSSPERVGLDVEADLQVSHVDSAESEVCCVIGLAAG
jgi:hypothetical protein